MFLSKTLLFTVFFMVCQFSLAAQVIQPLQFNQTKINKNTTVESPTYKTHQSQGSFPYDIPDNDPNGIQIPIDMTGLFTGNITDLLIVLDIEHPYAQDISATLISPGGLAHLVLLSRIDSGANMSGEYTFSDEANNDIWETGLTGVLPADEYRTSTAGFLNSEFFYTNGNGGCTTRLNGAFGGLTPDQSNGVWTLKISDNAFTDVGQVNNVYLIWSENSDPIFNSSFESNITAPYTALPASDILGNCKKAQYDFSGTGFSDYIMSYETTSNTLAVQLISNNGEIPTDYEYIFFHELPFATSEMTSGGDFDGDGITDFVFKSLVDEGIIEYVIRRSSRPYDLPISFTVSNSNNDSTIDLQIGDYDADGLDDFAFFVSTDNSITPSYLYIFESSSFQARSFDTANGFTLLLRPAGGFDHNGDNVADLALLYDDDMGSGSQIAKVYNGEDGSLLFDSEDAEFTNIVRIVPGTFLENNLAGLCIYTYVTNPTFEIYNDTFSQTTLFIESSTPFGEIPSDVLITGDYDGDGIDDFGVWRADTDDMGNRFIIRPSGSPNPSGNLIEIFPEDVIIGALPLGNIRFR